MNWWQIVLCVLAYICITYVVMYRSMSRNAGPGGLGMLLVPFAPLMLPLAIFMAVAAPFKKLWRKFKP